MKRLPDARNKIINAKARTGQRQTRCSPQSHGRQVVSSVKLGRNATEVKHRHHPDRTFNVRSLDTDPKKPIKLNPPRSWAGGIIAGRLTKSRYSNTNGAIADFAMISQEQRKPNTGINSVLPDAYDQSDTAERRTIAVVRCDLRSPPKTHGSIRPDGASYSWIVPPCRTQRPPARHDHQRPAADMTDTLPLHKAASSARHHWIQYTRLRRRNAGVAPGLRHALHFRSARCCKAAAARCCCCCVSSSRGGDGRSFTGQARSRQR